MKKSITKGLLIGLIFAIIPGGILFSENGYATEIRVSISSQFADMPDIWGDKIAFRDSTLVDTIPATSNIYLYDIGTGSGERINPGAINEAGQIIWDEKMVYGGDDGLYVYDIPTKTSTQITAGGASDIYKNELVYVQDYEIWLYDLNTGRSTQLTTSTPPGGMAKGAPRIWGDKVVWIDYRNDGGFPPTNGDIYLLDMSANSEIPICTNPANQGNPDIWGNKIVWDDYRNGNSDIYFYDLDSPGEIRITSDSASQKEPRIWGNNIVWNDWRNGNADIYMFDGNGQENRITTDPSDQYSARIWGNKIIWEDHRQDAPFNPQIYLLELPTYPISGHITRPDARGVNGVSVMIMGQDGASQIMVEPGYLYSSYEVITSNDTTGKAGYYEVKALEGSYTVIPRDPVPPTADFWGSPTTGDVPLSVNFADLSTGTVTGWSWDFGDGVTSTEKNPSHIYNNTGTYRVMLTASGPAGSDSKTKVNYIVANSPAVPPVADFYAEQTTGPAPKWINFYDLSTGVVTSWSWDFGDGATSTEQNPHHTYNAGTYTVTLTASGPGGSNTETKANYITISSLSANFTATTPVTGPPPLTVNFLDNSTPVGAITGWLWDFGDGVTSTEQNPAHIYNTPGYYTVSLTVTWQGQSDTSTRTNFILVTTPEPAPVASFTVDKTSGPAPLTVTFTDTSTGSIDSWYWRFSIFTSGEGTSTQKNTSHTYYTSGYYSVLLKVTGPGGSDTQGIAINVQ